MKIILPEKSDDPPLGLTEICKASFFRKDLSCVFNPLPWVPKETLCVEDNLPAGDDAYILVVGIGVPDGLASSFHNDLPFELRQGGQDFIRRGRQMAYTRTACIGNRIHDSRRCGN